MFPRAEAGYRGGQISYIGQDTASSVHRFQFSAFQQFQLFS
jgi:hypothetical protein